MSIIDNAIKAVRGFVFDMATGLLSEVVAVAQETAA
jgi:hypothetical protein